MGSVANEDQMSFWDPRGDVRTILRKSFSGYNCGVGETDGTEEASGRGAERSRGRPGLG